MKKGFAYGLALGIFITTIFNSSIFASTIAKTITVYPNYINLMVNGQKVHTENFLYEGTTYVPLREVAELLDKKVDWDEKTNTASIVDKVDPKVDDVRELPISDNNIAGVFKGYFKNTDYSNPDIFLNSGDQTKITKEIGDIAAKFNNKKDLSTIREIYEWMITNLKGVEGEKFGRTSHEIITSRGSTGCTDYGLAFVALSRAKGISTVFVQTARVDWIEERQQFNQSSIIGHILAEVYIDLDNDGVKEWYIVDTTSGRLYLDYDKNNLSLSEGYYVFAKSLEVWDSGAKDEKDNHRIMMDLFKDFDLAKYKNPVYDYIDLRTGEVKKSSDTVGGSTVIGISASILGEKEPVELFDSRFTSNFGKTRRAGFKFISERDLTSSQRIIVLYTKSDDFPDFLTNLIPELNNDKEEFIMNKAVDGRRIILIKSKDMASLMEAIKKLPDDFLDKDY